MNVSTTNRKGKWVPAIPHPYYGMVKVTCECGEAFWGWDMEEKYRGHYALKHILELD